MWRLGVSRNTTNDWTKYKTENPFTTHSINVGERWHVRMTTCTIFLRNHNVSAELFLARARGLLMWSIDSWCTVHIYSLLPGADNFLSWSHLCLSPSGPHSAVLKCPPNEYQCGGTELCIHMSKLCNGAPDCTDGWDEGPHCRGITPPPPFFSPPLVTFILTALWHFFHHTTFAVINTILSCLSSNSQCWYLSAVPKQSNSGSKFIPHIRARISECTGFRCSVFICLWENWRLWLRHQARGLFSYDSQSKLCLTPTDGSFYRDSDRRTRKHQTNQCAMFALIKYRPCQHLLTNRNCLCARVVFILYLAWMGGRLSDCQSKRQPGRGFSSR